MAAADAIRGTIRRKRSTLDDALDALDDDGRALWTRYLDDEVCAVVVWSERFGQFDDLPDLLAAEGFEPTPSSADFEDPRTLYLKADCSP